MNTSRVYRRRRAGAVVAIAAFALFLHAAAGAGADPEPEMYSVKPNDTLWEVAVENYPASEDPRVKVEEIRAENDLDGYGIQPGQTLDLP